MVNRIFLIGNLGRDPEMNYTEKGTAITKFTLAVNRVQRNRESGESTKETDWFSIVAWERLAEICNNYLKKGSKVFIEGRIQSRKYTDKNGVERTGWDVIASDMQMLDPRDGAPGRAAGGAESTYGGSGAGDQSPDDIPF
jgi:single-strand DNA-binding protein